MSGENGPVERRRPTSHPDELTVRLPKMAAGEQLSPQPKLYIPPWCCRFKLSFLPPPETFDLSLVKYVSSDNISV